VIPNSFDHIFEHIQAAPDNVDYMINAQYLEIYNEEVKQLTQAEVPSKIRGNSNLIHIQVRDLIGTNCTDQLQLKEDPNKGVYVKGLTTVAVSHWRARPSL
jgi:kinesin family protein 3/17